MSNKIWVCPACGRTASTRYGLKDTSCVLWGVEVDERDIVRNLNGKIVAIGKADPKRSVVLAPGGSISVAGK